MINKFYVSFQSVVGYGF